MQRLKLYIQIIECAMHVIGKQENASIGKTQVVHTNNRMRYACYWKTRKCKYRTLHVHVNKIISKYILQTKLTKAACIQNTFNIISQL